MSDTLNILKGIKPLFKRGETFYNLADKTPKL